MSTTELDRLKDRVTQLEAKMSTELDKLKDRVTQLETKVHEQAGEPITLQAANEHLERSASDAPKRDMSSEMRPDEIVKQFIELYKTDWVDVLEWFREAGKSKHDAIKELLIAMKDIYQVCLQGAKRDTMMSQLKSVQSSNAAIPGQGFDDQHSSAESVIPQQSVTANEKENKSTTFTQITQSIGAKYLDTYNAESWKKYVKRCIQICWSMSIQKLPMMLEFGSEKDGDPSDVKDRYLVQPAIYLHKAGPLLLERVWDAGNWQTC